MSRKPNQLLSHPLTVLLTAVVVLATTVVTHAERPPATKLLPIETVAFIRIADAPELAEKLLDTNFGRMG
ncbi:MAG: hypothetical protein IID44_32645, partial [Planctomycetes bacterium]|nr:hypothetical protein [Planctomycetota bacterium]